tara:strand:- start:9822 stop:11078 length:1257 start_codon:yes stop_codon:yes gene_type:complete
MDIDTAGISELYPASTPELQQIGVPAEMKISATPFRWPNPATIPQRSWLYGRYFLRATVAAIIAPGGIGKTIFEIATALALASGKPFLGKQVWEGPQRVWIWNLEDDATELERQITAAAIHHGISPADCGDRLLVDSAMEGQGLCTATEDDGGFKLLRPVYEAVVAELLNRKIDVLMIDPFVSSHQVDENANAKIDAITKEWARVAKRADCCVVLVHHTRKLAGVKVGAEASRGAKALTDATRSTLVLNRMDNEEAEGFGIVDDEERRRHFSVQDDKHNRTPPEKADWYRLASIWLGNGQDGRGDNIGVVEAWTPPHATDGINIKDLRAVYNAVADGAWRESVQSPDWVGYAIATALNIDGDDAASKARIKHLLKRWTGNLLVRVKRKDDARRERVFIEPGEYPMDGAPPSKVERNHV